MLITIQLRPFMAVHGYVALSPKLTDTVGSKEHGITWFVILSLPLYGSLGTQTAN